MTTEISQPVAQTGAIRYFSGYLMRVHVSNEQTNGAFSLVEFNMRPGSEPPMHIHELEDEMFYVKEGVLRVTVGDKTIEATAGQTVFLPRQVPHAYSVISPTANILVYMTPGNFVNFFYELSEEATEAIMPPKPEGPMPAEVLNVFLETSTRYGIKYVH